MPRSVTSNKQLLRELQKQADELACIASGDALPVVLKCIAARRRVTSVEFVPLLARAMLSTHPTGFRVFLNVNDVEEGAQLKERYNNESKDALLPAKFRFALAHELAHTLFYDLETSSRPKESRHFKADKNKTLLENLERSCNKLAGHLLMPSPVMNRELLQLASLYPEELISFSKRAGASVESLVVRLNEEDNALTNHDLRGCVAALRKSSKGLFVKAVARPHRLNIAREIRLLQAGELWQIQTSEGQLPIGAATSGRLSFPLTMETLHSSKKTEHDFRFLKYGHFNQEESYLVHLVAKESG